LLLIAALVCGGRRIRQMGYLAGDPVVLRMAGLAQLPSVRSVSRWLAGFDEGGVEALTEVNTDLVTAALSDLKLNTLTIDVDGTVCSTGLTVQGAERGFNPHHRKVPSYYPILALEAHSGLVLRCENRPGNVHDGKGSIEFLTRLFDDLDEKLPKVERRIRMDGAFFREDVLSLLTERNCRYAIKVPFFRWLQLREEIVLRLRWRRIDAELSFFEVKRHIAPWGRTQRVVIYRRKVAHATRKNFQLDLFDPDDGSYEYSAITTDLPITGAKLWHFMAGRGTQEKVYAELKSGYAFGAIPSRSEGGNAAWQQLNVLAFNLVRRFQADTVLRRRSSDDKCRPVYRYFAIHTLRFMCFGRAGILTRPCGRQVLDVGTSQSVRRLFSDIDRRLKQAA